MNPYNPAPPDVEISSEALAAERDRLKSQLWACEHANAVLHWNLGAEQRGADAIAAERDRLRAFVRTARAIAQAYASEHPTHVWQGSYQDPMGAHAWLEAESEEIGTARDGGDPKVERT